MAGSLVLLPAILLAFLVVLLAESTPPSITTLIAAETSCENHHNNPQLMFELQEAKLKIARLESIFEETVRGLNAKSLHLKESEKLIKEMTHEMDRLQSALSSLKVCPLEVAVSNLFEQISKQCVSQPSRY